MYHGEKVAFGTLTQLVLENVPLDELEDIILWCIEVGLPVTLAELGAGNVTDDQLMEVAKTACAENDTLHNMPFEVTPETVFAAIKAADATADTISTKKNNPYEKRSSANPRRSFHTQFNQYKK